MAGRYAIQPVGPLAQTPGAMDLLKSYALNKGANYALDAAVPGAGIGREIATQVALPALGFEEGGKAEMSEYEKFKAWQRKHAKPADTKEEDLPGHKQYLNMGGKAPLGGGLRDPKELLQARQLGALSQKEYLEALKHMSGGPLQYKQEGGGIHIKKGNEGKFTAKAKAAGMGVQEYARKVLASDSASPATKKQANFARNAAAWHKEDGGKIGPLAKTVHKMSDGETYEMNYHNPLAAKPAGDSK